MYLNLSGNEKLQIKSDVSGHGRPSISSIQRQSLAGFSGLPRLRVLGLMDVTITNTGMNTGSDIPDETDDRRVRTSSSLVNGLSYGIADTLGKNRHPHMMDLVHEFRGLQKDTVFAMVSLSARYTRSTMLNLFIVWSIPPSEPDGRDHLQRPPKISERQLHSRFHLPTQLP